MIRAFCLISILALWAPPSFAQCLVSSERGTFKTAVRDNLSRSDWGLTAAAMQAADRFGPGHAPARTDSFDPSQSATTIAEFIKQRLIHANHRDTALDSRLAALVRPAPQSHQSALPFRDIDRSMDEAFTQFYVLWTESRTLRAQAGQDPSLRAAADRAQRVFQASAWDTMLAAKARRLAHLIEAPNYDIGERLFGFWRNHFNVDNVKAYWAGIAYDKALKGAQCGTFFDLLLLTARHPAMLSYLDNFKSRVGAINQNYARELMELHTFGEGAGRVFTEADVRAVAQALSGWTWRRLDPSPGVHQVRYYFSPSGHDGRRLNLFNTAPEGQPLVLQPVQNAQGFNTSGAASRGRSLLMYLAGHPTTRRNICTKLSQWLLGISPHDIVEGCAADAVWGTQGDLPAVYRYLLTQRAVFHSVSDLQGAQALAIPDTYRNKVKNPFDWIVSVVRASGEPAWHLERTGRFYDLSNATRKMGIDIGRVPSPEGYADDDRWIHSGYITRAHEVLFRHAAYGHTEIPVQGQLLKGWALDRHFLDLNSSVAQSSASVRADTLDAATEDFATEGLGLWHFSQDSFRRARTSFPMADRSNASIDRPSRTLTYMLLGSPEFFQR